ncbi:MAG: hypothetical protein KAW61_06430, partial [candidate division Zixibacteria bacterium]|nr:hypothetical protein [candidate division Zixibacteria bacterium]
SVQGWQVTRDHVGMRACFANLKTSEVETVRRFLSDFRQYVILGLTSRLRSHFSDELDWCLALDYNAESPEEMSQHKRTPIGQLEYRAKYEESQRAVAILAEQMAGLFERVKHTIPSKPLCLSYIPSASHKQFDLPRELVRSLTRKLGATGVNRASPMVVHPKLTADKPNLKELPLSDKIASWRSLQESGAITLSHTVVDRTVVVVDDIYQSGVTLWSYAAYLKSAGAAVVVGMVCVKSCRDTDNL